MPNDINTDDEMFERLVKRWPDLMEKSEQQYFGVGAGWYNIIDTLCGSISHEVGSARYKLTYAMEHQGEKYALPIPEAEAALAQAIENLPVIQQIKEKFGGLRFYIYGGTDTTGYYIEFAELLSYRTCEVCGAPGERRTGGWIKTLCDHHQQEALAEAAVREFRKSQPGLFED